MLKQAEAADDEEDARYGKDKSGDELPEELSRRETRLQRIKEAKKPWSNAPERKPKSPKSIMSLKRRLFQKTKPNIILRIRNLAL